MSILNIAGKLYNINNSIKFNVVKLITSKSKYLGLFRFNDAKSISTNLSLDLIEISKNNNISVCKLMKYGKFQYFEFKKISKIKKLSVKYVLKEIRVGLNIESNDYSNKLNMAKKFLAHNYRVKISITIKGREIVKKNIINKLVLSFTNDLNSYGGVLENIPFLDNRSMILFFKKI